MVNLFNFMDGIDGLAAVQAVVAAFTLGFWFFASGETFLGLINFSVGGGALAFAFFNCSPARVFLGDVGSLSLGAWFGWMSILGAISGKLPFEAFLLLYGLFVFDASYTLVVRIIRGEDWWRGHRSHLYQRLVRAGWSHKQVSAVSLAGCITLAALASLNVSGAGHPVLWIGLGLLGLAAAAGQVRRIEAKIKR
jgi:UDP-N-acetylmuramyl pentapeptide phosphotransferase/UDP-N-acetylglucosamine-1-phosphate transferase